MKNVPLQTFEKVIFQLFHQPLTQAGSFEDDRIKKELKKFDPEIEVKLQQSKQWQHELYKDFDNPSAPTLIELLEKCKTIFRMRI